MITPKQVRELLEKANPGPWRVGAEGSEGSRVNPDGPDKRENSHYIAAVNGRVQPQDGYNARLIAAAPEIAQAYLRVAHTLRRVGELATDWEHAIESEEFAYRLRLVLDGEGIGS